MKTISNAELEVMKIIWQKEKATSSEIIRELKFKQWNANTIRTLINRLIGKKAIGICKKEGKTYIYIPLIKKREYQEYIGKKFLNQFFHGSILEMIEILTEND